MTNKATCPACQREVAVQRAEDWPGVPSLAGTLAPHNRSTSPGAFRCPGSGKRVNPISRNYDPGDEPTDNTLRFETIAITPDLAARWLGNNIRNRHMRPPLVASYARDMVSGNWHETGDPIKIETDGTVLDGQHRLAAIIKSGTTIKMTVAFGVSGLAQEVIDTGARRNFRDVLTIRGEENANILATTTLRLFLWEKGVYSTGGSSKKAPTIPELLETLEKNPDIRISVQAVRPVQRTTRAISSVLALAHLLFSRIDNEDCAMFFDLLRESPQIAADHPIGKLRVGLLSLRERFGSKSHSDDYALAYMIKAWNAYRQGRTIGNLKFSPGGAVSETFPEPI